jgi:hypothetical protein
MRRQRRHLVVQQRQLLRTLDMAARFTQHTRQRQAPTPEILDRCEALQFGIQRLLKGSAGLLQLTGVAFDRGQVGVLRRQLKAAGCATGGRQRQRLLDRAACLVETLLAVPQSGEILQVDTELRMRLAPETTPGFAIGHDQRFGLVDVVE